MLLLISISVDTASSLHYVSMDIWKSVHLGPICAQSHQYNFKIRTISSEILLALMQHKPLISWKPMAHSFWLSWIHIVRDCILEWRRGHRNTFQRELKLSPFWSCSNLFYILKYLFIICCQNFSLKTYGLLAYDFKKSHFYLKN